ncbi:geranylgeranyl transferase type-1 subunit beta [Lutzomyia longipalpis]|uniref:geranylgeranyl transferase type-1 subunit beta n=1 Tax=Lutzomyia longipalpis TaxID=7200 RepID=UPI002483E33C|nr:geranylgeranyl transferase type-1 subunit beta [Lutzomyia longipalpis]
MDFLPQKHAKYFSRFLNLLPARLASHDSTRVTIAFFSVCGLDILDSLELLTPTQRRNIIDWIYKYQVIPQGNLKCGGFQGSSTLSIKSDDPAKRAAVEAYHWGHLAMTYTGIAILISLGDNLSRLDREAIVEGVAAVQREDGSFSASVEGNEQDMRFVYCAAAICAMLNDWGSVDRRRMAQYIRDSIRYDYGVSQHKEMEGHGGTTFCAVAALQLSDQLHILPNRELEGIKRWLVLRQSTGFQGRPNKTEDTCYSFWIAATLKILNAFHLTAFEENRNFILSTQNRIVGGFSKWPDFNTDPFHTYFGICGLSFVDEPNVMEVMPSLNISMRAYRRLKQLHETWDITQNINDVRLNID